jgi:hypothetical protein
MPVHLHVALVAEGVWERVTGLRQGPWRASSGDKGIRVLFTRTALLLCMAIHFFRCHSGGMQWSKAIRSVWLGSSQVVTAATCLGT